VLEGFILGGLVDTIRNAAAAKMAFLVSVLFVLIPIKIWDREYHDVKDHA
jgi:hypothetical protein